MTYLELLQRALAEEIEATRLYLACMALAPREDLGVLLGSTRTRPTMWR